MSFSYETSQPFLSRGVKGWNIEANSVTESHVFEVVSKMVDITCKNITEGAFEVQLGIPSSCVTDYQKRDEQKFDNLNVTGENDVPVRRSNRIRKSVVKTDEIITPRSKKINKSNKNTDEGNLKIINSESKNSNSDKNSNEDSSQTVSEKLPKSRGNKSPKTEKNKKRGLQTEKSSTQPEKRKPTRKKKCNKNDDSSDNSNSIIVDDDDDLKTKEKYENVGEMAVSSRNKKIENANYNRSDNVSPKVNNDHTSDTDKSPESSIIKPVKLKSRWCRSSELEAVQNSEVNFDNSEALLCIKTEPIDIPSTPIVDTLSTTISIKEEPVEMSFETIVKIKEEPPDEPKVEVKKESENLAPPIYDHIEENIYRFNRKKCKSKKQIRRMVCDCTLTKEEHEYGIMGCKEECLNRLLMIECGPRCPIGEACSNKRFQKKQCAKTETFHTKKKGWGLRALENISMDDFLMEFVGEILNHKEYRQRVKQYAKEKNVHCYFMALKPDEILDATFKGNLSRFINHSCDPNCETQKWTVNGELRIGVFARRSIQVAEELTLDYQFQRYGREAQKCYCGAENCSGYIGGAKQISVDAYGGSKPLPSRKRKGSEDKRKDFENMALEEEIEKLNGSRGLRKKDDTLMLARLMVQADDSATRHQLLDIILRTEEQACLRLFLDYHGLPLLWSWMTDVVDYDLKAKILQVLSLLPISNKTMLLDSKILSIVEKWHVECASGSNTQNKLCESSPCVTPDDPTDMRMKKIKVTDFSDSETDSTSSQTVMETNSEISAVAENNSKNNTPIESTAEILKDNSSDGKQTLPVTEDPDNSLKLNIASIASGLLSNWKNLKEVFRIPRLEQQKRKEDEMEVDNNAKVKIEEQRQSALQFTEQKVSAYQLENTLKCGDQIQVVISGKNILSCHHRDHREFTYQQQEIKLEDSQQAYNYPRTPDVITNLRHEKSVRRHGFNKQLDKNASQIKVQEDISNSSPDVLSPSMSPGPQMINRPVLPATVFSEQPPPITYPPPLNVSFPPPQTVETSSSLIYPQIIYPQQQLPFMGPDLPPNPASMPPPASVPTQPAITTGLPQVNTVLPPMNSSLQAVNSSLPPPCQPIPPTQPNVGVPPPNTNNFLFPPNVPPPAVFPGSSQFIPSQSTPVQTFPPGPTVFTNQNQPLYFIPQQTGLPTSQPPSFTENISIQQTLTVPCLPVAPVKEEPPKPIKLPKSWRTASDAEGNVYYYHSKTRHTQWDPPSEEDNDDSEEDSDESEDSDSSDTPTYDEPKIISTKHSKRKTKKKKPTKAAADTSVAPVRPEVAKKIKELFRTKMSTFIVQCLNPYRKPSCTIGRISTYEDFKYLARKLTHYIMTKELKQLKNVEDLECNDTVQHKAKDFVKKYMTKYGTQYVRKDKNSPAEE